MNFIFFALIIRLNLLPIFIKKRYKNNAYLEYILKEKDSKFLLKRLKVYFAKK